MENGKRCIMCQKDRRLNDRGACAEYQSRHDKRRLFLLYIVVISPFSLQAIVIRTYHGDHDQCHPELEQRASQDTEPHAAWNRECLKAVKNKSEADIGKREVG
jgi:hypothetical protein